MNTLLTKFLKGGNPNQIGTNGLSHQSAAGTCFKRKCPRCGNILLNNPFSEVNGMMNLTTTQYFCTCGWKGRNMQWGDLLKAKQLRRERELKKKGIVERPNKCIYSDDEGNAIYGHKLSSHEKLQRKKWLIQHGYLDAKGQLKSGKK